MILCKSYIFNEMRWKPKRKSQVNYLDKLSLFISSRSSFTSSPLLLLSPVVCRTNESVSFARDMIGLLSGMCRGGKRWRNYEVIDGKRDLNNDDMWKYKYTWTISEANKNAIENLKWVYSPVDPESPERRETTKECWPIRMCTITRART